MSNVPHPDADDNNSVPGLHRPSADHEAPLENQAAPPQPINLSIMPDDEQEEPGSGRQIARAVSLPLIVEIDGRVQEIYAVQLQTAQYQQQLTAQFAAASAPPQFDISNLLAWSDADRWTVVGLIAFLEVDYEVADGGDRPGEIGVGPEGLFNAVLALMEGDIDPARCQRGVNAAIEAAGLVHPNSIPAACSRIARRLRSLSVRGYPPRLLQQRAERIATASMAQREVEQVFLRDVLPDAPIPEEVVEPLGWRVDMEGIGKRTNQDAPAIVPAPILITRRFTDVDDQAEFLEIAWLRDGRWQSKIISRAMIASNRTIVELAAFGVPVNSNNAADLVQYLADFEARNLDVLPRSRVTRHLGWQGPGGRDGFLWGGELLTSEAPATRSMTGTENEVPRPEITFRGADEGDQQLADGYRAAGTFEGWRSAVMPLAAFRRVRLAIYAALTAAMLEIFDTDNFIVSFSGATSQGKTITLRIAASCWGCADEKSASSALATWDATRVWFGRAPAVLTNLPLIVDDTKRAANTRLVPQMIYDVASGHGRGRGTKEGLARNETFRTVMLTTGESQITDFSEDGGTRARVLELWGSPFGQADAAMAQVVNAINDGVLTNYGHLGPRFVRFLVDNRPRWPEWREQYRELRQQYAQRPGGNSVSARMAAHLAAIELTARLVHEAVEMPWEYENVVEGLMPELTAEAPEADRAAAALRHVMSWVHSHRQEFYANAGSQAPHQGWAGKWQFDGVNRVQAEGFIGFFPHKLDEVLQEGGFEPEAIKRLWYDRNWLKVTPEKRQYRTRVGSDLGYLVAVKREAIEAVEAPGEVEDEPDQSRSSVPFGRSSHQAEENREQGTGEGTD